MSNAEKLKALKLTIDKIDKDYGKGSVMMMNERSQEPHEVISTGSIGLDTALGIGGLPKGRIIEIYGPESSGKTTVAIHVIAEAQKKGGMCAIIDAEHAFDSAYAKRLGVDVDNLLVSQPDYGEQALEIADRLILSGAIDVVVIDFVFFQNGILLVNACHQFRILHLKKNIIALRFVPLAYIFLAKHLFLFL